jgi:hypothetical protein
MTSLKNHTGFFKMYFTSAKMKRLQGECLAEPVRRAGQDAEVRKREGAVGNVACGGPVHGDLRWAGEEVELLEWADEETALLE